MTTIQNCIDEACDQMPLLRRVWVKTRLRKRQVRDKLLTDILYKATEDESLNLVFTGDETYEAEVPAEDVDDFVNWLISNLPRILEIVMKLLILFSFFLLATCALSGNSAQAQTVWVQRTQCVNGNCRQVWVPQYAPIRSRVGQEWWTVSPSPRKSAVAPRRTPRRLFRIFR